ncbi:hypothetical protein J3F83DRAFT_735980 [Trichoderma novae-zelandiae]
MPRVSGSMELRFTLNILNVYLLHLYIRVRYRRRDGLSRAISGAFMGVLILQLFFSLNIYHLRQPPPPLPPQNAHSRPNTNNLTAIQWGNKHGLFNSAPDIPYLQIRIQDGGLGRGQQPKHIALDGGQAP